MLSLWSQLLFISYKHVDPDALQRSSFCLKQTAGSRLKASTGRGSGSLRMKRRSRGKHDILKELSLFNPLWSLTHFLMSCEQRADGREHLLVRVSRYPHATRTRLWARWRCWSLHKSVLSDGLILLHPHHLQIFWFIWTFQLTVLCFTVTRVKHDFTLTFVLSSKEIFCHQKCFFLHQMVWK